MQPRPPAAPRRRPARLSNTDAATFPHEVGVRVVVRREDGSELHTTTRSRAWNLFPGCGLVAVVGIAGGISLDSVRLETSTAAAGSRRPKKARAVSSEQLPLLEAKRRE